MGSGKILGEEPWESLDDDNEPTDTKTARRPSTRTSAWQSLCLREEGSFVERLHFLDNNYVTLPCGVDAKMGVSPAGQVAVETIDDTSYYVVVPLTAFVDNKAEQ